MKTLDTERYPELTKLLEIICSGAAGWGSALRDLRRAAGLTQSAVASIIGRNRTIMSHYEKETHRPSNKTLRKVLYGLRVDVRLIQQYLGGELQTGYGADGADPCTDVRSASLNVDQLVASLRDNAGGEAVQSIKKAVLAVQIRKALAGDTKSAVFVAEWTERLMEGQRPRKCSHGNEPNDGVSSSTQFMPQLRSEPRPEAESHVCEPQPLKREIRTVAQQIQASRADDVPEPAAETIRYDEGIPGAPQGEPFGEDEPRMVRRHRHTGQLPTGHPWLA